MTLFSFRSIVSLASITILASSIFANQPPVFTNCIPSLTGSHCAPYSRDFDATDPDGDSVIIFSIVSGIGAINPGTGLYTANNVSVGTHQVTISVSDPQGSGSTSTCTFDVIATNVGPEIVWFPSDPIQVAAGSSAHTYIVARDDCDPLTFLLLDVGESTGAISLNPASGLLEFSPSAFDASLTQPVLMQIGVTDGLDTSQCTVSWKVLSQPTVQLSISGLFSYCVDTAAVSIGLRTYSTSSKVFGFDLLVTYDKTASTLADIRPGDLISECHWQYFYWTEETPPNCHYCPSGLIRITALAGTTGSPANSCLSDSTLMSTIAHLQFTQFRKYDNQAHPLRFFWRDCSDNIVLASTDTLDAPALLYSLHVFDFGQEVSSDLPLPTYTGAPTECLAEEDDTLLRLREVDFRNGYIEKYCEEPIDATGDINLNGLAYEFVDYQMLRQYFTTGKSAFAGHPEGSTAASDLNRDGLSLTLPDLIALYRIVKLIDPPPATPGISIRPTTVYYDFASGNITVQSDDSLGAIRLLFKGTNPVSVTGPSNILSWDSYDTVTSVLLAPTDSSGLVPILNGTQIVIDPPLPLLSVEATTMDARYVQTFIAGYSDVSNADEALPVAFELFQNYPNPFNPSTTIKFALPVASDVRIEIVNVLGQMVYEFSDRFGPGEHAIEWRGTGRDGRVLSSGVYYARLIAGNFKAVRKMMLLK